MICGSRYAATTEELIGCRSILWALSCFSGKIASPLFFPAMTLGVGAAYALDPTALAVLFRGSGLSQSRGIRLRPIAEGFIGRGREA